MSTFPSLVLPVCVYFAFSILAWQQPGCPHNENVDVFYETVATRPRENQPNWLCDQFFELKVNVCSILFKTHIIPKFGIETMQVMKHPDTAVHEDCVPFRMRFKDAEGLDVRVDVRMFRCPVKFKVENLTVPLPPIDGEVEYEFYITKGNANLTVALLLTSGDKFEKFRNICLEDLFLYNDINGSNINKDYIIP